MRIKIKHNTIIFEREREWRYIKDKIRQDFGLTILVISWRLKQKLGFTVRYHKELIPQIEDKTKMYYQNQVHLDFYTESAQSWFMLKYINLDS